MNFLVTCVFDLKAASAADYRNAYEALKNIGLEKTIVSDTGGNVVAPTTLTIGQFSGQSGTSVRDAVIERVKEAFTTQGLRSEVFVTVAENWAWGAATT